MSIGRMLRVASIILGSLGLRDLAVAGTGDLGATVEQARKTEFFRWFHLEETGRTRGNAGTVVHFKPSADKFRRLVTVNLSLDSRQRIIGAELVLSRSFIDSGREGMFARYREEFPPSGDIRGGAQIARLAHRRNRAAAGESFHDADRPGGIPAEIACCAVAGIPDFPRSAEELPA